MKKYTRFAKSNKHKDFISDIQSKFNLSPAKLVTLLNLLENRLTIQDLAHYPDVVDREKVLAMFEHMDCFLSYKNKVEEFLSMNDPQGLSSYFIDIVDRKIESLGVDLIKLPTID